MDFEPPGGLTPDDVDATGRWGMSEISRRYRMVADGFTRRVEQVPEGAWDDPAPCDGWVARDVVGHIVEWMPPLALGRAGIPLPQTPSVADDPVGAWTAVDAALQGALDDPELAAREFDSPAGHLSVEQAIGTLCIGDLLVHTWDLARATGLDETLDPVEVHELLLGMQAADELLRQSGHYGPKVEVPESADEQTKLIAFTGRRPWWAA
jgi:uncharacterized protein (TIGR03086 family)